MLKSSKKLLYDLTWTIVCLIVMMISMGIGWKCNSFIMMLSIFVLGLWLLTGYDVDEFVLFIFSVVFFQFGEMIMIRTDAWSYSNPTYFGIPIWLPFVWGFTSVLIKRIYFNLSDIRKHLLKKENK